METKFCKKCQCEHPVTSEFWIMRKARTAECRASKRARERTYQRQQPSRKLSPAKARDKALRIRYGITQADYECMCEAQNHACAICGTTAKALYVDHDHVTGSIRGLLCPACNTGIGLLGDNVDSVAKAVEYLKRTHA